MRDDERLRELVPDAWALLNVKADELRAVARGEYDPEEVDALLVVVADLRAMFSAVASGALFGGGAQERMTALRAFAQAGTRVQEAFRAHGYLEFTSWHVDPATGRVSEGARMLGDGPNVTPLFKELNMPLWLLWMQLQDVQRDRLYTCQQCGKIGPAERAGRLFCGGTCKKRWYRSRPLTRASSVV